MFAFLVIECHIPPREIGALTIPQIDILYSEHPHTSWRVRATDYILAMLHGIFAGPKSSPYQSLIPPREIDPEAEMPEPESEQDRLAAVLAEVGAAAERALAKKPAGGKIGG